MKKSSVLLAGGIGMALFGSSIFADIVAPGDVEIENLSIATSLSGEPGNPAEGKKTFANRKLGNCLACHANADLSEQLFHGEVGPALDGVASRWTEEQLRTIVVNSKVVFTDQTVMPAFYSLEVGEDVREDLIGKTILSAQEVEDIVAYLITLK
ncbi:MAG: sulfur oxidation c-type cytochrome SoxX [Granulosicoccus sp.]